MMMREMSVTIQGGMEVRNLRGGLAAALLYTAGVVGGLAVPAVASAQSAQAPRSFNIAAQPLADALMQFGQQSGLNVSAPAPLTRGLTSPGVSGSMTAAEALSQLLAGTGLTYRFSGPASVRLERAPQAAEGAIQLGPVRIEGQGGGSGIAGGAPAPSGATTERTGSYATRAMATATKLPLSIRETPQSVSVITRQQIEDENLVSLIDVLANTPGIATTYADSDRAWFKSRGFSITNFQIDGITIDNDSGYSAGEDRYDTAIFDRIEVVRGSTGLLTGSGNPSAMVNLIRKRADSEQLAGTIEAAVGSWSDFRGMIDLQSPLGFGGAVRGRVVAAYQDKAIWLANYSNKKLVLFGTLAADLTPDTLLTLSVDYQDNDPKGSGWGGLVMWNADGSPTDLPRSFNMGARWTYWASTTRNRVASLEHRFNDRWNVRASYTHSRNEMDSKLLWAGGYPDAVTGAGVTLSPAGYTGHREQDAVDVSLVGKFRLFGGEHDLNVGYAYRESEAIYYSYAGSWANAYAVPNFFAWDGNIPEPDLGDRNSPDTYSERQQGLYGVVRLALADGLKLIAGGRQSRYRSTTNGAEYSQNVFTPYGGLVYDISSSLSAYVSYSDIFAPQDLRDRNGDRLDPITGNTIEAGIKGEWLDGRLTAALAVFEIRQDNVGELDEGYYVPGSNPRQEAYVAVDGVRSRGFEVQVSGEIRPDWNVTASYAHHNTTGDDDGDVWSSSQPSDVVRIATNGRVIDRLWLGASVNWQSDDWCNCNGPDGSTYLNQKAYAIANATARFEVNSALSAQLNVNNLFDKKYFSQIGFYSRGTYGPPRSAVATLRYRF